MKLGKLVGAGIGFIAGSVLAGVLYTLVPSDIAANITADNFKLIVELVGAYVGYSEF